MKKVLMMLRHHWKENFDLKTYGFLIFFLIICLSINYYLDFEDDYLDTTPLPWRIPAKFLFFAFSYYTAAFIVLYFNKETEVFRTSKFWVWTLFIITCTAFDSAFPIYEWVVKIFFHPHLHLFLAKVFHNLINIPFIFIPAAAFYFLNSERNGFYGVFHPFDAKPYFILLLIMMPLLLIASSLDNFSSFYPMFKPSLADEYWNIPEYHTILIYELFYGWNFLSVEFIFRGFLVIGMAKILGRQAILPMVALYCFYHFGKPAGEAISSIFGGYILGVIAFETRSISGGVILHVGIAWTMEALGFWF